MGQRLAYAALAIVYGKPINWRSPTYKSAKATAAGTIEIALNDVEDDGLVIKGAFNYHTGAGSDNCVTQNAKAPFSCAWAGIQFNDIASTWVNATVSLTPNAKGIVLSAALPDGATRAVATSYGWGAVPMLNVYRAGQYVSTRVC